ncbi:MAG: 4-alpha-glucanotransferase [Acidobacteria bacterium]|nr:4-alpha-glucanotransferase [Acidobacteriota bacterium]
MNFPRASGILLHPTSLPSKFGIGDLGDEAYWFVDFLAAAKQTYWQVLPLGPTGYGDSPYQCFSAFAGNTNLISPQKIVEDGFLTDEEINQKPDFPVGRVDFGKVYEWKNWILTKAYERFRLTTSVDLRGKFETFCQEQAAWLEDYTLFRAIKKSQKQTSWQNWDAPLKLRDEKALAQAREDLREEIQTQKFQQWLFFRQWNELKNYCHSKNIKIVGDVPIFVALDSADVWCNPSQFKLNENGSPTVVAGVPPDYFSKTGQLWGNPIYNWEQMRRDGFRWWTRRVKATLRTVDIVRVDHFRGFAASWEVPGGDTTAQNGRWMNVPGKELFNTLKNTLDDLPFWAEDLGVITPDVEELRDGFGFPGMRILQFAFGGGTDNHDLPHNYIKNCVAYTGTHDNDTTVGWFNSQAGSSSTRNAAQIKREREFCLDYLKSNGKEIHWDFIQTVWESVADTAIAPMQDLLGLGNEARMNLPASSSGNWYWQCREGDFSDEIKQRLRGLTEIYGRVSHEQTRKDTKKKL